MYSFAYLVALREEMSQFHKKGFTFTSGTDSKLYLEKDDLKQEVDYIQYKNWQELPLNDPDLTERVNCSQELLGLPLVKNFESALGLLCIEEDAGSFIEGARVSSDQIHWQFGSTQKSLAVENAIEYNTLVAAHCVRRGYIIREIPGRHFLLRGPTGLEQITTAYNCSCINYRDKKDCEHVRLVKTIMTKSTLFYRRKVVRLN